MQAIGKYVEKRTKCARLKCKSPDIVLNLVNKQAYFRYCTWVKRWGAKVCLLSLRCIYIFVDTCLRYIKSNLVIAVNWGLKTFLSRSIRQRLLKKEAMTLSCFHVTREVQLCFRHFIKCLSDESSSPRTRDWVSWRTPRSRTCSSDPGLPEASWTRFDQLC